MTSIKEDEKKEIPEIIHDPQTNCTYQRLRFFGKVSFSPFSNHFCGYFSLYMILSRILYKISLYDVGASTFETFLTELAPVTFIGIQTLTVKLNYCLIVS